MCAGYEGRFMQALDVAVVGTGTAGSACALLLARAGHRVTVYERVNDPQATGAGIMLQPTGMAVLRQLGLEQQVVPRGERIDQLFIQTPQGRQVMSLDYAQLSPELFGVGLHRGVLFSVLFRAACAEPGVTVRTGLDVAGLHTHDDGRVSVIERGTQALHGPHDLVVSADGARSALREATTLPKRVDRYPWGALWAMVPDPERRFTKRLFQVVRGTQRLVGLLPTGVGPDGGPPQVSFFYSLRANALEQFQAGDFAAWKAGVLADVPQAAPVLTQLPDAGALLFSHYHDVRMWPWHEGRVVYLGDAAHAMSPQLGQGCNLALLDAWELAQAVRDAGTVFEALATYSRRRRWHLRWYQFITRALTPFFQSDHTWLRTLRDVGLAQVTRVPWVRRQMVAAMAGVSRGPGFDLLQLPG
jgi:2-polyprenyl-6-methoxyphenol hydroxylase-like FAD-dependent oxidoreductase